ncbi:hypothetical protein E2C01_036491 [Portunus trituberculatus]|uniref:Uncharacterized protein n=1 Tax=Portunus trituberculatus TaxID=210409 RepID=A0A5B7F5S4_PORTR|nr:hypothetical protein [Portunus trituberculatus]
MLKPLYGHLCFYLGALFPGSLSLLINHTLQQ